jgi:hypothetical protein
VDLPSLVQTLIIRVTQLLDLLLPFFHPNEVVLALMNQSFGQVSKVWFGFVLSTTDFETGNDFISNVTIQRLEPRVQVVADAALVLMTMWAAYRIMWGHGLRSQYTARILLPRLLMGVVLINFSLPILQVMVAANNALCKGIASLGTVGDPSTWWPTIVADPTQATWEISTTAVLVVGYDVLAIAYVVRYSILIVLAVTAPLAGLFYMLPETHHLSKMWASQLTTNLFMQPFQLFVLTIGFALERAGALTFHHLFALASLLIVFKVPGALGGSEKMAHKLQSTVDKAFTHIEHALVKA